jgi:hypothetical protein
VSDRSDPDFLACVVDHGGTDGAAPSAGRQFQQGQCDSGTP